MKSLKTEKERILQEFSNTVAIKIHNGFKLVENNDKLPFAVLLKEGKEINHSYNFMLFCVTFGLWTLPWIYKSQVSSKTKKILVAIDEEGNIFEEKCY
jgi:hypothetical protein